MPADIVTFLLCTSLNQAEAATCTREVRKKAQCPENGCTCTSRLKQHQEVFLSAETGFFS